MDGISLQPITPFNWVNCIDLEPTEEQQEIGFVAPNVLSLAQAYAEPWWQPLAIYNHNTMVGFTMYGRWPDTPIRPGFGRREPGVHAILRMMIDRQYQGRGYGRAALLALIERIRAEPGAFAVEINYDPGNAVGANLYTSLGFQPTGEVDDGEIRARLVLGERTTQG